MQIIRWHIDLRAQPPKAEAPPGRRTVVHVGIESSHLDDVLRRCLALGACQRSRGPSGGVKTM